MGFFEKIKEGLAKTKKSMSAQLNGIFAAFTGANEEFFEELEETLILADIGVETTMEAVEGLREVTKREGAIRSEYGKSIGGNSGASERRQEYVIQQNCGT